MQFQRLTAPSLKELFVEQLENKILSGELAIGEKLPSERELADYMQVSRAVINAGVTDLVQKGFLEVRPRIGVFVADYRKKGSLDVLISIINYHGGVLAQNELKSVIELRMVLTGLASYLTILHASDADLADLTALLEDIRKSVNSPDLVEKVFHLYHELCFVSGNVLLPLWFFSSKKLLCKIWQDQISANGSAALVKYCENFMQFILARDKEKALRYLESSCLADIFEFENIR